jgi:hypothetical protein
MGAQTQQIDPRPLSLRVRRDISCRLVQAGGRVVYGEAIYQHDALLPLVGAEIEVRSQNGGLMLRCSLENDRLICHANCAGSAWPRVRRGV